MANCQLVATPMVVKLKLPKLNSTTKSNQQLPYQQAISKLLYLTISCHPNIYYAIHYLSLFVNRWSLEHWEAIKCILHYLKGTIDLALCYNRHYFNHQDPASMIPQLTCNANHGPSSRDDHKSISTIKVHLCGGATTWLIKNQKTIVLRTTKSELNTISQAVQQALYMRKLFKPLQIPSNLPIQINNNNHGALNNVQSHKSTYTGLHHHYNVKIKHAHNCITNGIINIC